MMDIFDEEEDSRLVVVDLVFNYGWISLKKKKKIARRKCF
jgi:hypothetical protein